MIWFYFALRKQDNLSGSKVATIISLQIILYDCLFRIFTYFTLAPPTPPCPLRVPMRPP